MSTTNEAAMDVTRRGMWRSRWAAVGAAVAVSLGAGGLFVAQAAPGPSESTIVTVTPERILDTRDPNNVGLAGPFVSAVAQKLQVTGSIPTATGTKTVVPTGATGVLLNVTPVNMTAAGFLSIRPGDATGAATTSSLNFTTGVAGVVPNAVQVAVPTAGPNAGKIDITYDAYGQAGPTTDILIDVVGYMTNTGLQELVADVAALKATTPIVRSVSTDDVSPDPTTDAIILSVTIVAPVPGVIQAVGGVWFASGPAGSYECHLTDADRVITTSDPFEDSDRRLEKAAAGAAICTTNGAAAVPAGTYKINLAVDVPGAGADVDDASLDVVFFPGSGTVTSSLSEPVPDTDN